MHEKLWKKICLSEDGGSMTGETTAWIFYGNNLGEREKLMTQKCLLQKQALPGMVYFNLRIWEAEAGGISWVQGYLTLLSEFQFSWTTNWDPVSKNNNKKTWLETRKLNGSGSLAKRGIHLALGFRIGGGKTVLGLIGTKDRMISCMLAKEIFQGRPEEPQTFHELLWWGNVKRNFVLLL